MESRSFMINTHKMKKVSEVKFKHTLDNAMKVNMGLTALLRYKKRDQTSV